MGKLKTTLSTVQSSLDLRFFLCFSFFGLDKIGISDASRPLFAVSHTFCTVYRASPSRFTTLAYFPPFLIQSRRCDNKSEYPSICWYRITIHQPRYSLWIVSILYRGRCLLHEACPPPLPPLQSLDCRDQRPIINTPLESGLSRLDTSPLV